MLVSAALAACAPEAKQEPAGEVAADAKAADATQVAAKPLVVATGEGLTISGAQPHEIAFGTSREEVEEQLAAILGEPQDRSTNGECGAGPVQFTTYPGPFTLNFQNGIFLGWIHDYGNAAGPVLTDKGIGVGSGRKALDAVYKVKVLADSTLDGEFTTDTGIGGFLDEDGPDGRVVGLYAGLTCFFR